ncbi:hypothetical protein TRVA0_077S00210 [Trichomonascus vanleenenianus]|uniref:DUF2406 domain-containing protein n=1 Tax=Trichomonascus vanleenenianus TaxID=2268995 RepID=UPI003ECB1753
MNSEPVFIQRSTTRSDKHHSGDIHDPILKAIHDAQPFEESMSAATNRTVTSPETRFRDIFGNVIQMPDRSNPTRMRDERPLDTIRSFEYSCYGDERIRDEMETPRLGWTTRRNFQMPHFETNPYQQRSQQQENVISFSQPKTLAEPVSAQPEKKKKRGLFGRKKK